MNKENTHSTVKIALLLGILLYSSCVSIKKYNKIALKADSINSSLLNEVKKNYIFRLEYLKLKGEYLSHLKQDSIIASNSAETNYIKNSLISFPNPPPQPSSKHTLDANILKKFKKYKEIDNWIIKALDETGYNGHTNYFLFDDGFAIATDIEQVNEDATFKKNKERWSSINSPTLNNEFSIKEYFKILFKAQPGYYRSFVFIVSPSLNRISPDSYPKDLFAKYLSQGALNLPKTLGLTDIPPEMKVTVLLYEFKKPENSSVTNLVIEGNSCFDHMKKSSILKKLSYGN